MEEAVTKNCVERQDAMIYKWLKSQKIKVKEGEGQDTDNKRWKEIRGWVDYWVPVLEIARGLHKGDGEETKRKEWEKGKGKVNGEWKRQ